MLLIHSSYIWIGRKKEKIEKEKKHKHGTFGIHLLVGSLGHLVNAY